MDDRPVLPGFESDDRDLYDTGGELLTLPRKPSTPKVFPLAYQASCLEEAIALWGLVEGDHDAFLGRVRERKESPMRNKLPRRIAYCACGT